MEGAGAHNPPVTITTTKRIKRKKEKIAEEDRISSLPDCLLVEILSRLPSTKYAIRTSTLSKRWQHVWTFVHALIFDESDRPEYPLSSSYCFVDKTLTQCHHQSKLTKFEISCRYYTWFESHINNWICFAINHNVQRLTFLFYYYYYRFVLKDELFFNNPCFTHLDLRYCDFNPIGAITWKNLTSLLISDAKLDEDLIQNILSGSPLLDTLELIDCYGFRRLDVTCKSVKNLVFSGFVGADDEDIININAPHVLTLTIKSIFYVSRLLLLDVSSLVKVNLDYILLLSTRQAVEEDTLKGFILKCRHAKELNIGSNCSRVLSNLKANGFIYPPT